ncbi:MAG TPA: YraN family protein [Candidatus Limnocylindrales bacterium]|nr:YraN family protein [Candidatus Limnocylindrales bacterium]
MRTAKQEAGDEAEALVAARLLAAGWTVLGRNVHAGRGELDLVAIDPGPPRELVIVEVRRRTSRSFGLAEETVAYAKRSHLRLAIGRLLEDGLPGGVAMPRLPLRVDLVVVEPGSRVRHHRGIEL